MAAGSTPSPSPKPPGTSALAAGARLPLAFIVVGLLAGMIGTAWLAIRPELLALPHMHPHVVALAHVWLPGCLLTICFGAIYQLLPVLANVAFRGERAAWCHLALHTAGSGAMVAAFLQGNMLGVAIGGSAVSIGVVLLGHNVWQVLRTTKKMDPILASFACSAGWLMLTVLAGLFLAANRHWGFVAFDALAGLRAHAHLGVVGFFVTLLQGASFRLVPMFTLGEVSSLRRVGTALATSQAGLLILVISLAVNVGPGRLAGASLLAIGLGLSGLELVRTLALRRKKKLEPGVRGFLWGMVVLAISTVGGLLLAFRPEIDLYERLGFAYGILAILGGVLGSVEGMLCKIVPFLTWMRVYGPRVGRMPTPVAATLARPALESTWIGLHFTAVVLLTVGAALANTNLLAAGAWIFAAAQAALNINLLVVLKHNWRPIVPQPAAPRPSHGLHAHHA